MIKFENELTIEDLLYYLDEQLKSLRIVKLNSIESNVYNILRYIESCNRDLIITYEYNFPGEYRGKVVSGSRFKDLYEATVSDLDRHSALLRAVFWVQNQDGFDFPETMSND